MRGKVLRSPSGSDSLVWLDAAGGQLVGAWRGDHPVDLNDVLDVEIDVQGAHTFDELSFSQEREHHFEVVQDRSVAITGRVVEIDHLDVMTLDLGGALLSLEMEGDAPVGIVGATVTLIVSDLEVHPTGV